MQLMLFRRRRSGGHERVELSCDKCSDGIVLHAEMRIELDVADEPP